MALVLVSNEPLQLIQDYAMFVFLGIVGAVFASATGAGGGVVFVPFFEQLNFDTTHIVATSFAIQCFGMTAGAISWFWFRKQHKEADPEWQTLACVLKRSVPFSILGILLVQYGGISVPHNLHTSFGLFSVVLAISIFASIPMYRKSQFRHQIAKVDDLWLPIVSLLGGVITGWLSVGVGELVAIYLIFRGFNVSFAIASAVILSAFSVWGGVVYHLFISQGVYWPILAFAGLGAVIGGSVARYLVLYFSVTKLKMFFAAWVLLMGLAAMPIW
ncbi:MAG: sulfite exporter TauE/SafE family protein [Aestuariibacter sp.]